MAVAQAHLVAGLAELTLETDELARTERFYRWMLGLELISRGDDRVWLALGAATRLGLWSPGEKEFGDRGARHVHFAISISPGGLERLAERLRADGTEITGPVEHPGGDRSIYFEDPAGNVVEAWDFFHRSPGAAEGLDALR
ncbi:MAG: VOC family protein [Solirubrobacterales bacterium]|nr:VOC family protein [Solirubrobacterales bacterium]MBV9715313.1 VOC family protein [Solirubrobacterales bacterium]